MACYTENIEQYKKCVQSEKTEEEWQADSLAAALLMPKDTFQIAFSEAMRNSGIWRGYLIAGVDKESQRLISKTSVATIAKQTYTGSEITPVITVKYGKITLVKDVDYTLSYENNLAVGTASVTIKGKEEITV